ncbi:MAG: YraN family protein [Candidatus Omnitrophica bacterium]|nr:YraN family protein [Candidatus Omnitrophota bacterium]MCM8768960.1 YraN family protein [Candidatus Omnitrophota bacterium]
MTWHSLGKAGELIAAHFLRQKGYRIIQQNFKTKCGEIDIIARDRKKQLVFIEVKTRSSLHLGQPEESVTPEKLVHLRRCAQIYLSQHRLHCSCRLEILSIIWGNPPTCKIIPAD